MSSDTTAGSTTTTGGSGPTVTVPTPIFLECGRELTATIALAILIAGHHAPATHPLIGVGVATARAGLHAANWLKVTGLQHVPVYAPKDEDAPDAGDAAAAAAVVPTDANEGSKFIGARYPPLNAHAIHHESYLVAFREYVTKKAHPILIVFLSTHAAESQREADLLAELRNGATESGQSLLAGAPIFARDHHTTIASSSAQRVDLLTAVMLALPTLPTTPTPFSELLQDVMADVASDSLAQLLRAIVGGGGGGGGGGTNDLQAIVTAAIQAANEKSHINKARKSKAPPQKPLRPGQVLSTAPVTAASSSAAVAVSAEPVITYPPPGPLPTPTPFSDLPESSPFAELQAAAARNVSSMLLDSLMYDASKGEHLFILYDQKTELTRIIARGYRQFIEAHRLDASQATFLNFNDDTPDSILSRLFALKAHDSVILVQSQQFRLNDYRIRLELFKRNIRSIEHVHLEIIRPSEYAPYVDALAFSPKEYGALAYTMKDIVDRAETVVVTSKDGSVLTYNGGMQPCKLNIGDYRAMASVGGTYPIGEVFSEAKVLSGVNGEITLFGYPSLQKQLVLLDEPIRLSIREGVLQFDPTASPPVVPLHSTPEFTDLLTMIRDGEGEISVREFGMGLNRAMSRTRPVCDIFAFERHHGLHISVGKKHNVYKADGIKGKTASYHIDLMCDVDSIVVDGVPIFQRGEWTVDLKYNYRGEPLDAPQATNVHDAQQQYLASHKAAQHAIASKTAHLRLEAAEAEANPASFKSRTILPRWALGVLSGGALAALFVFAWTKAAKSTR